MGKKVIGLVVGVLCLGVLVALVFGLRREEPAGPKKTPDVPQGPYTVVTDSGIEMILIPGGRFKMGSPDKSSGAWPVHEVQVDSFLIDKYEVTQEQYVKLAGINPSSFKDPKKPVELISWVDAVTYCNLRSRAEGLQPCYNEESGNWECDFQANGYRLTTEAEWEYACRAGTETEFYFGRNIGMLRHHAWYTENSSMESHPVGRKKPNPWGLYDIHGNVAEWCNDVFSKNYYKKSPPKNPRGPEKGEVKVVRGGGWRDSTDCFASSWRCGETFNFIDACIMDSIGIRCARNAPGNIAEQPAGE